jgi:hypothetical protein
MALQTNAPAPAYFGSACYDQQGARQPLVDRVDLDSLWDDRQTFLYNCNVGCLYRLLDELKAYWLADDFVELVRPEQAAEQALSLFKLDVNTLTPLTINKAYSCATMQLLRVVMGLNVAGSRMQVEEKRIKESTRDINRIMRVIKGMHELLQSTYEITCSWRGTDNTISSKLIELHRYTPIDESKAGTKGLLIRHITQRLAARRLRRCGSDVFEEIIVNGHHTHAWRRLCSIKEFIYQNCQRHMDIEAWTWLHGQRNMELDVEKYLVEAEDIEFPELKRDRHIFSFRNGIYLAYRRNPELEDGEPDHDPRCDFLFYHELEDPQNAATLDDSVVAINYFDVDMPMETIEGEPSQIPTPNFDLIFTYQDIPPEALAWIYVLVGRLFYDLRELDDWEVLLFIKGVAGSGKSTLGRVIRRIYPASCVGYLSSNVQKKFALEGIFDKLIWICYEMRENWADNIDQADLQSMISGGEEVVVNCKFKRPLHMVWTAPGLAIGNQSGGWQDSMGCITRRVVPVEFNKKVTNVDTRLFNALHKELPNIIVKCNGYYQEAVERYATEGMDIWEAMSEGTSYFKDNQAKLRRETNSFADFLENCDRLQRDADKFMPYSELTALYRNYCKQYSTRPQRLTGANFTSICREESLQYSENDECYVRWLGRTCSKMVYGIGYKEGLEPAMSGAGFGGGGAAQ